MKRVLALFLGVLFLFSVLPISILAEKTDEFYEIAFTPPTAQRGHVLTDSYSGDRYITIGIMNMGNIDTPKIDISLEKGEHIMISELLSDFESCDYLPAAIFDKNGNAIYTYEREIGIVLTKVPGTPVGEYADTLIITDTATGECLYYDIELIVEKDIIEVQIHVDIKVKDYGSPDPEFTYRVISTRKDYEPIVSVTLEREPGEEPGDYEISCIEAVLHNDISNEYQTVSLATYYSGNLHINDDPMRCGEALKWSLLNDGTLVISGTGDMTDYSGSDSPWYSVREAVKSVVIEEGVTSIGSYAFSGCGIGSVSIPDSVTDIGEKAFINCSSLANIIIPDSVTHMGEGTFSGCSNLNEMVLPFVGESIKTDTDKYQYPFGFIFGTEYYNGSNEAKQSYYGESTSKITRTAYYIPESLRKVTVTGGEILQGAFDECDRITYVILGDGVKGIGDYAFEYCTYLKSIVLGDSVTSIGNNAFRGCPSLVSINVPDSVTSIGEYAFYYCTSLNNITIPEVVANIGDDAFTGCASLMIECVLDSEAYRYAKVNSIKHRFYCPHIFDSYVYNDDATCTEDGTKTAVCDRCDSKDTVTAEGTALGHTASEWQIIREPELGVEGEKVKCCTVCSEIRETESIPALKKEMTFTDVKAEHWYYNAVEYCFMEGIISGVGDNKFAPQTELSRAMLVRILWNMEDCPKPTGDYFTDIGTDRWYTDAVNWAAENGIVAGMDSEHFCPEDSITREQLAAIMQRYSAYLGNDTSARADLYGYDDSDKISSWAYESMQWAVSTGLISGRSETILAPKGTATRAETAQIIYKQMN